jgi:hypothetical protein
MRLLYTYIEVTAFGVVFQAEVTDRKKLVSKLIQAETVATNF